jgi:hypothetical protein
MGFSGTDRERLRSNKLIDMIEEGTMRDGTNPRDRIYAFLDITYDYNETDREIVPNYTTSIEEVYMRFARWCILKKKDLKCLSYAGYSDFSTRKTPSWVPTWDFGMRKSMLTFAEHMKFLEDLNEGKITAPALPGTAYMLSRQRAAAEHVVHRPAALAAPQKQATPDKELKRRHIMDDKWGEIFFSRLCSTSEGRLGWAPMNVKEGDIICIFNDTRVPFVLRPMMHKEEGGARSSIPKLRKRFAQFSPTASETFSEARYELIGECYLRGMMQVEAMKMPDLEEQIFELC